jgi:CyaY protein
MSEQDFLAHAEATLDAIEAAIERAIDSAGLDAELERQGNVLTLSFDDGTKVIINSHSAAREIWVAAKSGGFHYRPDFGGGGDADAGTGAVRWIDGRSGDELFGALSRLVSAQGGVPVVLSPR